MGFDYAASRYNSITEDQVRAVCPDEFAAMQQERHVATAKNEGIDALQTMAQADEENGYLEEFLTEGSELTAGDIEPLRQRLTELKDAFRDKTGLRLHEIWVPEGFRGSDVSEELIWHVGGYEDVTDAGRRFEEKYGCVAYAWHLTGG